MEENAYDMFVSVHHPQEQELGLHKLRLNLANLCGTVWDT